MVFYDLVLEVIHCHSAILCSLEVSEKIPPTIKGIIKSVF